MTYRTHVFDCDGVLIRSNTAKADAFYQAALPWGEAIAQAAAVFHRQAGSISRRARWEHIFTHIIGVVPFGPVFEQTIEHCSRLVAEGIASAELVPGAVDHIERCEGRRIVVSGVEQPELGHVLDHHDLTRLFDAAYGGPKTDLLATLVADGTIELPAVYYGDTRDDWQASTAAGLDFVLVTGDTDWTAWPTEYHGPHIASFMTTVGV